MKGGRVQGGEAIRGATGRKMYVLPVVTETEDRGAGTATWEHRGTQ